MRDRKNVMKNNILTGPLFFIENDKNRRKTGKSPVARRRTPCYDGGVSGKTGTAHGAE